MSILETALNELSLLSPDLLTGLEAEYGTNWANQLSADLKTAQSSTDLPKRESAAAYIMCVKMVDVDSFRGMTRKSDLPEIAEIVGYKLTNKYKNDVQALWDIINKGLRS